MHFETFTRVTVQCVHVTCELTKQLFKLSTMTVPWKADAQKEVYSTVLYSIPTLYYFLYSVYGLKIYIRFE